jgi:hypothetical protein
MVYCAGENDAQLSAFCEMVATEMLMTLFLRVKISEQNFMSRNED